MFFWLVQTYLTSLWKWNGSTVHFRSSLYKANTIVTMIINICVYIVPNNEVK